MLWNNTRPQEPKAIQELIQTIKDNSKPVIEKSTSVIPSKIDESLKHYTVIKIDDFENALKAVALVSRQEATEDYHKSFSIFVAMLALFGIGFPVLVAFMQHRFNEKQLDKIEETSNTVDKSKKQADDALKQAQETSKQVKDVKKNVDDVLEQAKDTEAQANKAKEQADKALKQAKETSVQANAAKTHAELALKRSTYISKQANLAKDQAEIATKQAHDAIDESKDNLEQINRIFEDIQMINFEMHNEMIVIHDGLKILYNHQSLDIKNEMACYYSGQSILHFLRRYQFNQNYRNIKNTPSMLDQFLNFFNQDKTKQIDQNKYDGLNSNIVLLLNILIKTLNDVIDNLSVEKEIEQEKEKKEIDSLQNDLVKDRDKMEEIYNTIIESETEEQ